MDSPGSAFLAEELAALLAGILSTPSFPLVHLAAASFAPGPGLDPSTLTEATYDGYAAKLLTGWGTPHLVASGNVVVDATPVLGWTPTGSLTPNTIYGWWVIDHAGNLVSSGLLPAPVLLHGTATTLSFVFGLGQGPWNYTTTVLP
jgi:hypothetical protein